MPQLVPFYFMNETIFAFCLITLMLYVFSKHILPNFVRLLSTRFLVCKL
uniref:ATP synthase protein 8 n=1 Tax=Phyllopsora corallina TaxID=1986077 RepID=A0A1X9Q0T7_9LECA|nr:ATP synthase subunit 8 [Phyllopsora corallina]ARQ15980.1 ATP synthase subunit 8 [Phyllopsora corallina]